MDTLTPDDLRVLIETEDEYNRRGCFARVFPNHSSRKYLKFFDTPRYYNLLLAEWLTKHRHNRNDGNFILTQKRKNCLKLYINLFECLVQSIAIAAINYYCKRNIHRQNPALLLENQVSLFDFKYSF